MRDFFKDTDGNWWFKTLGKCNKLRQIAVSNDILDALKRYREKHLKLPSIPYIGEKTPLLSHVRNPNSQLRVIGQ